MPACVVHYQAQSAVIADELICAVVVRAKITGAIPDTRWSCALVPNHFLTSTAKNEVHVYATTTSIGSALIGGATVCRNAMTQGIIADRKGRWAFAARILKLLKPALLLEANAFVGNDVMSLHFVVVVLSKAICGVFEGFMQLPGARTGAETGEQPARGLMHDLYKELRRRAGSASCAGKMRPVPSQHH